jgi:WhiB family redox-sensing transcriptional regulator
MTFHDPWLIEIAWRLDRLRWTPRTELSVIVRREGTCMRTVTEDEPSWIYEELAERELAELICGGCEVKDECLELELRTAGDSTLGVWGGLSDDDRRALYPHWCARGERAEGGEA